MQGRPAPKTPDANEEWEKALRYYFQAFSASRTESILAVLMRFETSIQHIAMTLANVPSQRGVLDEVSSMLQEVDNTEHAAAVDCKQASLASMRTDQQQILCGIDQVRQLSLLLQEGGGSASMMREAQRAHQANDLLRSQLAHIVPRCANSTIETIEAGCQIMTVPSEEIKATNMGAGRRSFSARQPGASFDCCGIQSSPDCARSSLVEGVSGVCENRLIGTNTLNGCP